MSRALLALVVAFIAACAPASSSPSATASPPASTARTPADAAPPSSSLSALPVGTSGDYPPLSIWKGDHAEGFAPELVASFASLEKRPIAWTRFRWPELMNDMRSRRFDLAADGITVRPERSIAGRFTVPIARGGAILLVRRPRWASVRTEDPRATVAALDRPELRVVVNQGGHLERLTRELMHHASIRAIADNGAVRDAFARGEADAAMTNTFEGPRWEQGLSGIERVGPLSRDVTALWVRPEAADLAERLDAWLLGEEENGRLQSLREKTFGPGLVRTAAPVTALFAAIGERLALMPFVAADKKRTGKPIEDRPQEARVLALAAVAVSEAARKRGVPAPSQDRVEAFFRAQIEAAKRIQEKAKPDSAAPTFSLESDLRPAIARIDARIAFLLVRLLRDGAAGDGERGVLTEARESLADSGLDSASIDALGAAVAALRAP